MHPAAPRPAEPLCVDVDPELREPAFRLAPELVLPQRGEELAAPSEARKLPSDDRAAACRLGEHLLGLHDLARSRDVIDQAELHPLDVPYDGNAHNGILGGRTDLTEAASCALQDMMEVVADPIPPFERFYLAHRDEVLGYLRRLLGQRAEDAWQETFLRALRAYDRLTHGRHLRAWVFTIATNVAMDELRPKARQTVALDDGAVESPAELRRDAFRELEHLTNGLPPTERAAVVLRYGYDLPYAEIGAALGSSEEAARAAASSGVRRLRRDHERHA
jgi:RNA polymerase sigma factor (sigma-70 family)